MQAARDSQTAGDRVLAESFLQHAEHYFRLMKAMQPAYVPQTLEQRYGPDLDDNDDEDEDGEGEGAEALEGEGEMPRRRAQHDRPPQDHRPRDDQRHRDDRPREERHRDDRPRDERHRDDRPREERYRGDRRDDRGPRPPLAQPTAADQPPREPGEFSAEDGADGFRGRRRRARGRYRPGGGDAPYPIEGTDQPSTEDRTPREEAAEPRRERRDRPETGPVEGFGDGVPAFLAGE
jgi:hypothetical protein